MFGVSVYDGQSSCMREPTQSRSSKTNCWITQGGECSQLQREGCRSSLAHNKVDVIGRMAHKYMLHSSGKMFAKGGERVDGGTSYQNHNLQTMQVQDIRDSGNSMLSEPLER